MPMSGTRRCSALHSKVSFVDAHWYPFDTIQGVSSQQILGSVRRIPSAADHIRSMLHRYAPQARFTVGETNISERPTTADFGPVSALFAAATSLEWLAAGALGVDWWDLNNYGTPTTGDFGLLSSGSPESQPANSPLPPYYGEVLASRLTSAGSRLRTLSALPASLLGFESDLHGQRSVLLVNPAPNRRTSSTPGWFRPAGRPLETYSAATSAAAIRSSGRRHHGTPGCSFPPSPSSSSRGTPARRRPRLRDHTATSSHEPVAARGTRRQTVRLPGRLGINSAPELSRDSVTHCGGLPTRIPRRTR